MVNLSVKQKRFVIILIIFLSCLIFYLSMSLYFLNHFFYGSTIGCVNVSFKTVNEADKEIKNKLKTYSLKLNEQNGIEEEIKGSDINLKYKSQNEIQEFKQSENPFYWVDGLFNHKQYTLSGLITFDQKLLKERINNLKCFKTDKITEPKNANFKYVKNGYEIIKEINGNKMDKELLCFYIEKSIHNEEASISFKDLDCYEKPKYTSNSTKILSTKKVLDKYTSMTITYTFGEKKEVIDGSKINTWLKVDDNLKIIFDEGKVKNYVDTLANTYDTVGKSKDFATSSGIKIKISGGDYGKAIDRPKEVNAIIAAIKKGKSIAMEPIYTQTSMLHGDDIGNTYVEIDLTKQCIWFYKNGNLIIKGNVVTGNVSANNGTPEGVYNLDYKKKNTVLRGPDYNSPVTFWMPFNGGIGIHDASWRTDFGGEIYKTRGSHGCVNAPYDVAEKIFNNIEPGTPVVCHY